MSAPLPQHLPSYQFHARPKCTPGRTIRYIGQTIGLGLMGGLGFGGVLGATVLMVLAAGIVTTSGSGWRLFVVTGLIGAILLGYVGWRAKRRDGGERDDLVVAVILYALAGTSIGAAPLLPFTLYAWFIGMFIGILPGVVLWLIYGLALVLFTRVRYSPAMDVAAFCRGARRLAALTVWLAVAPLGVTLYLLFGSPTSSQDVLLALVLLTTLATLTAPFAWWHSKFLIDWWLNDIAESRAR